MASSRIYEKDGKFSINKCYTAQISWKRLICNNKTSPKSLFITWLAVLNRLATKFTLAHWNMVNDTTWLLRNNAQEDVDHLSSIVSTLLQFGEFLEYSWNLKKVTILHGRDQYSS